MNSFCIFGVSAIIEKKIGEFDCILIQERKKGKHSPETGLLEIPCGKVKKCESVFDTLRSKVFVETGLRIVSIEGEDVFNTVNANSYKTINYIPFFSSQNLYGNYPIVIETFICKAEGELLIESYDAKNIHWISYDSLRNLAMFKLFCKRTYCGGVK